MKTPNTIFEQLYFNTVRVEADYSDGNAGTGTAFFFTCPIKGFAFEFLVTNRHVIDNAKKTSLRLFRGEETGPVIGESITVEIDGKKWIKHPDPDIDVAVLTMPDIRRAQNKQKQASFYCTKIDAGKIPSDKDFADAIDAVEEVFFVGYPNGIVDEENLMPVVRRGTTATPMTLDFDGTPTFLLDASIFQGSSGSPVFMVKSGAYSLRGEAKIYSGSCVYLLGIVASVFYRNEKGKIEVADIPTEESLSVEVQQMIDLGIVFKSSVIMDLAMAVIKKTTKGTCDPNV